MNALNSKQAACVKFKKCHFVNLCCFAAVKRRADRHHRQSAGQLSRHKLDHGAGLGLHPEKCESGAVVRDQRHTFPTASMNDAKYRHKLTPELCDPNIPTVIIVQSGLNKVIVYR